MLAIDKKQHNNDCIIFNTTNISIINHLSNTDKLDNISEKNIADRQTINVTTIDSLGFEQYKNSKNIDNKVLASFLAKIFRIYQQHGLKINYKVMDFIIHADNIQFKGHNRVFDDEADLYNFLKKVILFTEISLETPYNKIADVIDYIFDNNDSVVSIQKDRVLFFKSVDIEAIAKDKELYRYIKNTDINGNISENKFKKFCRQRKNDKDKKTNEICRIIHNCKSVSRKNIIGKYVNNILELCDNRDLDINNEFLAIIKKLTTSVNIDDNVIEVILKKIISYLQAIVYKNSYTDISMLTNLIFDVDYKINEQLLFSFCNITNAEQQDIASSEYLNIKKNNQDTDLAITKQQPMQLPTQDYSTPTTINKNNEILSPENIDLDLGITDDDINLLLFTNYEYGIILDFSTGKLSDDLSYQKVP